MNGPNVLPLFDPPRQKAFRAAVAKVIRDVKAAQSLSNVTLAEEIGCCADTISNAENENNDLSAVILLRIAYRFGESAIDPVRSLYLRRYEQPKTLTERFDDALAEMAAIQRAILAQEVA